MVSATGEQLQKNTGSVRSEARRAPVGVTYHGRPELVVLSVEDYALQRRNRKIAMARSDMPAAKIEGIANNRMDEEHAHLDALMDDDGCRCRRRSSVWSFVTGLFGPVWGAVEPPDAGEYRLRLIVDPERVEEPELPVRSVVSVTYLPISHVAQDLGLTAQQS